MTVKLLTEHHLEFLSLKRGYTGLSETTLVKMPHCWKSHITAYTRMTYIYYVKLFSIVFVCLFNLTLYAPATIFQLNMDGSSCIEPVLS